MHLDFEQHDRYLKVTVTGPQSRDAALAAIESIAVRARSTGQTQVLVDGRELTSALGTTDIFAIAEHVARIFGENLRVAFVYRAEFIDGFGETVAVNRGAAFTVRTSEHEALAWLVGS